MRKEASIAMFTCVMASIGSFLRWLQNNNIYEADTGLAIPSAWSSIVTVVCAITVVGLLILTLRLRKFEALEDYRTALRARTILYPAASFTLGAGMSIGAVSLLRSLSDYMYPVLNAILAVLAILCGVCYPLLALGPKKDSSGTLICTASFMPVLFFCYWLVTSYRENSADPVLWSYAFEILAISSAVLAFYYVAGYAFMKPRPLHTIFFCQLGAFFCSVTLGDNRLMAKQIFFFCTAAMLLMLSVVLTARLQEKTHDPL